MDPILEAARAKRAKAQEKIDALLKAPTADSRPLNDVEQSEFEALAEKIKKTDKQVDALETEQKRRDKAAAAAAAVPGGPGVPAVITREQMTYDLGSENSFFRDLAALQVPQYAPHVSGGAPGATLRMTQHHKELDVEARNNMDLRRRLDEVLRTPASLVYRDNHAMFEQRVNPNTTFGTGGEFVPPLWLVSQYVPFLRPGRIFANRCQNMPLPPGIDVINIPKITVGSLTAIQTAQAAAVASQDIATTTVSAAVRTIAGQEDISLQLLEQSPLAMDNVIFDDLGRDYDQRLDIQIIAGTGSNGQHLGVLNVPGVTSNTVITNSNYVTVASAVFHDASTAGTQYRSIVNGVNQVETLRFMPPTAIWAHPRRTNSWAYASDTTARPLFITNNYGQFNVLGVDKASPIPQGIAGELFGLPAVKDANMPTTMNGSTVGGGTADAVAVLKEDDLYLYEGAMRIRALPEILSGTLQIRYQVYAYSAFIPNRFPPSISILTGNVGLGAPGF